MKQTPKRDVLADLLLANPQESWSRHFYEHIYGQPMPTAEEPEEPSNVLQFPKRLTPERRRQILRAAWECDDV
jgi:hypothetical protein